MPDHDGEQLRPASREERVDTPAFARRFQGGKRFHDANDAISRIAAEPMVEHMLQSRFVLMKASPLGPPMDLGVRARLEAAAAEGVTVVESRK